MLKMLGVALLMVSACAGDPVRHVFVPNTREAASCWRECAATNATCRNQRGNLYTNGGASVVWQMCEEDRNDCLLTCPGAKAEWYTAAQMQAIRERAAAAE